MPNRTRHGHAQGTPTVACRCCPGGISRGWEKSGATETMHDELRRRCRIAAGRDPEPTAAIIDSQSVRAAETAGKPGRGYDSGKKISG